MVYAKSNRVLIMFGENKKGAFKAAQDELNVKLVSSEELNSQVRAQDIMDDRHGILFKNLNIASVDGVDKQQLQKLLEKTNSNVIAWEEERLFTPANIQSHLDGLKGKVDEIQQDLLFIEEYIQSLENKRIPTSDLDFTWGLKALGVDKTSYTGKGVDVCILDTGFYADHPDFRGRNIIGKSFIEDQKWEQDGNGHGTHCVGVATGDIAPKEGLRYGVANQANIVVAKVLSDAANGTTSSLVDALDWVLEKKYKIVSMSLGSSVSIGEKPSQIFEQIGRRALENNTLIIAASGNDSRRPNLPRPVSCPANSESIMAVGAVDANLNVAGFSNAGINASNGGKVDLVGPGMDIFSSFSANAPKGTLYSRMNGTSMATPHLAGLAALYWEANPALSATEVWFQLEKKAKILQNQLLRDVGNGLGQVP